MQTIGHHPNVVTLLGVCTEKGKKKFVTLLGSFTEKGKTNFITLLGFCKEIPENYN